MTVAFDNSNIIPRWRCSVTANERVSCITIRHFPHYSHV